MRERDDGETFAGVAEGWVCVREVLDTLERDTFWILQHLLSEVQEVGSKRKERRRTGAKFSRSCLARENPPQRCSTRPSLSRRLSLDAVAVKVKEQLVISEHSCKLSQRPELTIPSPPLQ